MDPLSCQEEEVEDAVEQEDEVFQEERDEEDGVEDSNHHHHSNNFDFESLKRSEWYHGHISKKKWEKLLIEPGSFLIKAPHHRHHILTLLCRNPYIPYVHNIGISWKNDHFWCCILGLRGNTFIELMSKIVSRWQAFVSQPVPSNNNKTTF